MITQNKMYAINYVEKEHSQRPSNDNGMTINI